MTRLRALCLLIAVALTLALAGCSRNEDLPTGTDDAGRPVDPALLAFLSRARSAHHIADGAEEKDDLGRAVEVLRGLVAGPLPSGNPPEVREVLSDTRARLADLESRRGNFDKAARDVDDGLELATETTYFRGHLFEVRGLVEERRAKALEKEEKTSEAQAAKKRALDAFEESMKIQAEVIKKAVPTEAGP
ncbi:MAG: hypothetical protein KC776_12555 [Myxococcales bacterium]|nr:hypothetical protein [Myxococcales bacterium]MCB9577275.1 hypothetical protein [Polyangiaceae bacterium]